MGIPNYLVSATLSLVVAQRLPRKICSKCKTEDTETTKEQLKTINYDTKNKVFKGKGCNSCNKTGYSGRNGVYEILKLHLIYKMQFLQRNLLHKFMKLLKLKVLKQ